MPIASTSKFLLSQVKSWMELYTHLVCSQRLVVSFATVENLKIQEMNLSFLQAPQIAFSCCLS